MRYNKVSESESTTMIRLRVPESMKEWLDAQPRGLSATIRAMVKRAMARKSKQSG